MVSRREFEELPYEQVGFFNKLVPPLENQTDTASWHEKLAHVEKQIPPFTQEGMEGAGGNGFKGIAAVDGVIWSWWMIREPFQRVHQYIDTRGKVVEQRDWTFISFSTPLRTAEETARAKEFARNYGRALQCVLIQRAYDARNLLGQRRG